MEDKKTRTTKKIDLLTSVESIVYLAKGSKLNKEFYRKADKYLKFEFDTISCHFLQSCATAKTSCLKPIGF